MKIFNKIQYIALFVLSLLLIGFTSVISGDLKWESFRDPLFYVQNLLAYAATACVIVGTLLFVIDKFKRSNQEFIDGEIMLQKFASETYVPSVFSRYCDHANRKRKINQFIYNTKKKLFALEKRAKEADLYAWNNEREKAIKAGNIYCMTRKRLESQLEMKWIEANIDKLNVKYDKITANIILGGEFSKSDNFSVNDYVTKYKAGKVVRDKAPLLLLSFGITCFASSIGVGFSWDAGALIVFLVKLIVLVFNTFMSIRYANKYTQTVTLRDVRFRKGIVKEYNLWVTKEAEKDKSADTAEADKIYEEAKHRAEEQKAEQPQGIMKALDATPVGAVIDIIKEAKEEKDEQPERSNNQNPEI